MFIGFEKIYDSFNERIFGANYYQFDIFSQNQFFDFLKIINFDIHIRGNCGSSGISGSHKELFAIFRLSYFPGKSMFSASRTYDKYIHYLFLLTLSKWQKAMIFMQK